MSCDLIVHEEYRENLERLTDSQRGILLIALMDVAADKEVSVKMDDSTEMAFMFMKQRYLRDRQNHERVSEARRKSGRLGGRPKTDTSEKANESNEKQTESKEKHTEAKEPNPNPKPIPIPTKEKEKVYKEKAPTGAAHTKRFTPPTLEEVKAYCQERNNGVNPERFMDFYTSKGWKVGTSPMKDWKACVRTWEHDDKKAEREEQPRNKFHNFEQRKIDYNAILKAREMKEAEEERKAKEAAQKAEGEKSDEEAVS